MNKLDLFLSHLSSACGPSRQPDAKPAPSTDIIHQAPCKDFACHGKHVLCRLQIRGTPDCQRCCTVPPKMPELSPGAYYYITRVESLQTKFPYGHSDPYIKIGDRSTQLPWIVFIAGYKIFCLFSLQLAADPGPYSPRHMVFSKSPTFLRTSVLTKSRKLLLH